MIHTGIFKFVIGLIGMSLTVLILIWGLVKKDNKKIKRAVMVFIATWIALLLVALTELILVL